MNHPSRSSPPPSPSSSRVRLGDPPPPPPPPASHQTPLPSIRQLHPYLPPSGAIGHLQPDSISYPYSQHQPPFHSPVPLRHEQDLYAPPESDGEDLEAQGPPKKKRRRQALSCTECKRRKIKCDRNQPCAPCTRRGEQSKCQWHIVEPVRLTSRSAPSPSSSSEKYVSRAEFDALKTRVEKLDALVQQLTGSNDSIPGPSLVAHSPINPSGLAAPVGEVAAADAVVAAPPPTGHSLYYQFGSHHQGTLSSTGHGVPGSVGEAMQAPQPHLSPKILSGSHLDASTYHSSNLSSYRHHTHTPQPTTTRQMPPPTNYPSDSAAPASIHHQRQHHSQSASTRRTHTRQGSRGSIGSVGSHGSSSMQSPLVTVGGLPSAAAGSTSPIHQTRASPVVAASSASSSNLKHSPLSLASITSPYNSSNSPPSHGDSASGTGVDAPTSSSSPSLAPGPSSSIAIVGSSASSPVQSKNFYAQTLKLGERLRQHFLTYITLPLLLLMLMLRLHLNLTLIIPIHRTDPTHLTDHTLTQHQHPSQLETVKETETEMGQEAGMEMEVVHQREENEDPALLLLRPRRTCHARYHLLRNHLLPRRIERLHRRSLRLHQLQLPRPQHAVQHLWSWTWIHESGYLLHHPLYDRGSGNGKGNVGGETSLDVDGYDLRRGQNTKMTVA